MNEEIKKFNYKPFILAGILILGAFIGLGLWVQNLHEKIAEILAPDQNTKANLNKLQEGQSAFYYMANCIQAGYCPSEDVINKTLQQQKQPAAQPEQQEPLPMTPSPVPTKAK